MYFSRDSASITAVIPAMDTLTDSLNKHTNTNYYPTIVASMKLAKKKMDRYYSLTDSSEVYRIAMGKCIHLPCTCSITNFYSVLHPGLKLEYFRQHDWEAEWIEQAENMTREEYITTYEAQGKHLAAVGTETAKSDVVSSMIIVLLYSYLTFIL